MCFLGSGLGFQAFGVVIDNNMLYRIGSTLVGALSAGLPIIYGLRPDLDHESAPTDGNVCTATCDQHMEMKLQQATMELRDLKALLLTRTC